MEGGDGLKFEKNPDLVFWVLKNCLKTGEKKLIIEKLIYYQVLWESWNYMLAIDADLILWIC